jgi:alpha,alpha-trehalase
MKRIFLVLQFALCVGSVFAQEINTAKVQFPPAPNEVYGVLFEDVQRNRIFPDGKTFVDCVPKKDPKQIVADYLALKNNPAVRFSLRLFVENNFIVPESKNVEVAKKQDVKQHIESLWPILRREPDKPVEGSSLLALPYPYIVPGGRFREIYYWDSYFTMLGLRESGQEEMIENMIKNFAYLINQYGFIPNGNRSYYLGRSQPPYFALMIELLAEKKGGLAYALYLDALQKEYDYYMDKSANTFHVMKMPDGSTLNRYFDKFNTPRQESFLQDEEVAKKANTKSPGIVYRHLRSGAESGWDFSSRWFRDGQNLHTIQTTNYIPVDLNCLLYQLEITLSKAYKERGNLVRQRYYEQVADKRKKSILKYCWSAANGFFMDYNIATKKLSPELTIAGAMPLFFKMATPTQARSVANVVKAKFLKPGGVVTTLKNTGQQWDAPNGWAPLQWLTIAGLRNYTFGEPLAETIAQRWIKLNVDVYDRTGKLMEKYNVMDTKLEAGGGEYPSQDGFGWTNGVLLKLIAMYGMPKATPAAQQPSQQ